MERVEHQVKMRGERSLPEISVHKVSPFQEETVKLCCFVCYGQLPVVTEKARLAKAYSLRLADISRK